MAEAASYAGAATDLLIEARESIDTLLGDWAAHLQHDIGGRTGQALAYALKTPGKRVRAALLLGAYRSVGGHSPGIAGVAAAVETVHAYSLVHDDLPCMDDDVLRRGKPTVHVEYDEATALLVGDALQSLAFQLISENSLAENPAVQLEMVKILAAAAGSRGMAGGQCIDLESTGKALSLPELEFMHIHKTGALIRAAVTLGAYCGSLKQDERTKLDKFAKAIGLAFQVVDDVLDSDASTATLGKTAGKDSKQGKPTYVSAMGVSRARSLAEELRGEAHAALTGLGGRARRLAEVADFIVLRKF